MIFWNWKSCGFEKSLTFQTNPSPPFSGSKSKLKKGPARNRRKTKLLFVLGLFFAPEDGENRINYCCKILKLNVKFLKLTSLLPNFIKIWFDLMESRILYESVWIKVGISQQRLVKVSNGELKITVWEFGQWYKVTHGPTDGQTRPHNAFLFYTVKNA
jgi:hypothetical protein